MAKKNASGQALTDRAGLLSPQYSNGKTDVYGDNWSPDSLNNQLQVHGPKSGYDPRDPQGLSEGIK